MSTRELLTSFNMNMWISDGVHSTHMQETGLNQVVLYIYTLTTYITPHTDVSKTEYVRIYAYTYVCM